MLAATSACRPIARLRRSFRPACTNNGAGKDARPAHPLASDLTSICDRASAARSGRPGVQRVMHDPTQSRAPKWMYEQARTYRYACAPARVPRYSSLLMRMSARFTEPELTSMAAYKGMRTAAPKPGAPGCRAAGRRASQPVAPSPSPARAGGSRIAPAPCPSRDSDSGGEAPVVPVPGRRWQPAKGVGASLGPRTVRV